MRTFMMTALGAALAISMSGCGNEPDQGVRAEPKDTKLKSAYDACDVSSVLINLADGNKSILINGVSKPEDFTDVACLTVELDTPEYIVAQIEGTTAMMGRQSEEDTDGITYDWSYHPDNGLDMVIHEG